jgi:SAM-dependent methyltransferase
MGTEVWAVGAAYEAYVGRWSRLVAAEFLHWLAAPDGYRWLDVGCGTGALAEAVLDRTEPARVVGVDRSVGFLTEARTRVGNGRSTFLAGDAGCLPLAPRAHDAVVSALALNFIPDPYAAVAEFGRVLVPGGLAAAYVWDYADGMQMMRYFWDAAASLDLDSVKLDEGRRFSVCRPEPLQVLWASAGLRRITVEAIDVPTVFTDFDDYWRPFLGGQGPAPTYTMSLPEPHREQLRTLLSQRLPVQADGSIHLTARAWAVRGTAPV